MHKISFPIERKVTVPEQAIETFNLNRIDINIDEDGNASATVHADGFPVAVLVGDDFAALGVNLAAVAKAVADYHGAVEKKG